MSKLKTDDEESRKLDERQKKYVQGGVAQEAAEQTAFNFQIPSETEEEEDPHEKSSLNEAIRKEKFKAARDKSGNYEWSDKPTFENQFTEYPSTYRLIGPKVDVFNLAKKEELNGLNNLLSRQNPETAPEVLVTARDRQCHEGNWTVFVEYFEVEYQKLLRKN